MGKPLYGCRQTAPFADLEQEQDDSVPQTGWDCSTAINSETRAAPKPIRCENSENGRSKAVFCLQITPSLLDLRFEDEDTGSTGSSGVATCRTGGIMSSGNIVGTV